MTGQYRTTNEDGVTDRARDWVLGVGLTWDLFDGRIWIAEGKERRALAHAAHLKTQALEQRVDLDVQAAIVALHRAKAAVRQAIVADEIANRNATQTAQLYRQRPVGALEMADANLRLFEADVALARGRFGLGLALLDLRSALGLGPFGKEPSLESAKQFGFLFSQRELRAPGS